MATERHIANARRLRQASPEAEARLWSRLRARQLDDAKFVRQQPVSPYAVDFCCRAARLIVEVDGGQHHDDPADLIRTDAIMAKGYVVLRFWNSDVLSNTDGVMQTIRDMLRIARGN